MGRIIAGSAKKKQSVKYSEDLLVKMWHTVRTNNGIMVGHMARVCTGQWVESSSLFRRSVPWLGKSHNLLFPDVSVLIIINKTLV